MASLAPKSLIAVQLHRNAFNKPWGFRLQGGADQGQWLTVQRVFMQSPSEGILHRGDTVIRINDFDASRLTLQDAEQLVNNTALTLRMEVQRSAGTGSTPTSPQPQAYAQGPPSFQRQNSQTYQQNLQFQQDQIQRFQQQDQQQPQGWQNSPTLQMIQQSGAPSRGGPRWEREDTRPEENETSGPGVRRLMEIEKQKKSSHVLDYAVPLPNLDKLSVTNQTYRTNNLIAPGPKAKHYRPMGSYLQSSFGRQEMPQPKVAHDSQYSQYNPTAANTRSFNRGQSRPKSVYDQPQAGYGGSLSPYSTANGIQRQSQSPVPPQQLSGGLGGRQWPPRSPPPPSPPAAYSPNVNANPFSFNGAPNYGQPQQQQQNYGQPQQQQRSQLPFQIPQASQGGRQIIHSAYNSPAGLYNTQNAVDMFTAQTGVRPNQVSGGKALTDFKESPTYKFLMESQGQRHASTAWGAAPRQSRAMESMNQGGNYGLTEL